MRKALAQRWYMAGKQLLTQGRADECRECFNRALYWQPLKFRAWKKLAAVRMLHPSTSNAAATPFRRLAV